jgi:hypothetical protein
MWSIFVYFIIFLVPGLFAALVYNLLCCKGISCCKTIALALVYDLLIIGINFAALDDYLHCLSFTPKYILLSLVIGIVLAILTCLFSRLLCCCSRRIHGDNHNCCKK